MCKLQGSCKPGTVSACKAGACLDEGGAGVLLGSVEGCAQAVEVGVAILDVLHVPAERLKARGHILCEGDLCVTVNGNPAVSHGDIRDM